MKHVGVDLLQLLPAHVVVAVASGGGETGRVHPVFLEGGKNLGLVVLRHGVDGGEAAGEPGENSLTVFIYGPREAEGFIHSLQIHGATSFL